MREISEALDELLIAIRESEEFKNYQEIKRKLHASPEVEKAVNEFRKKNYRIQNDENTDLFRKLDDLEEEKATLLENPLAAEYLAAELAFCRIIQKINWRFVKELDFEVGFGNEGEL